MIYKVHACWRSASRDAFITVVASILILPASYSGSILPLERLVL